MTALELYGCYIPRIGIILANLTGTSSQVTKVIGTNYICPYNVFWTWVIFGVLLLLLCKGMKHYLSLHEVQEEIDAAKEKQKRTMENRSHLLK